MLRFILIRLLQALPVILVVITATFFWRAQPPAAPLIKRRWLSPR